MPRKHAGPRNPNGIPGAVPWALSGDYSSMLMALTGQPSRAS